MINDEFHPSIAARHADDRWTVLLANRMHSSATGGDSDPKSDVLHILWPIGSNPCVHGRKSNQSKRSDYGSDNNSAFTLGWQGVKQLARIPSSSSKDERSEIIYRQDVRRFTRG